MKIFSCQMGKMSYFCSHKNGGTVAQLVEQRTENPRVTGSIPVGTTKNLETQMIASLFLFAAFLNQCTNLKTRTDKTKKAPSQRESAF